MLRFLLFFCFFPLFLTGQNHISGCVLDGKTNMPIANATVYLDGTTKGTTTDKDGNFSLTAISFPCNLIISHVSYNVRAMSMDSLILSKLNIILAPRLVRIGEFQVMDKNERENNILTFKKWFLGNDYWGSNAEILNDSVLFFIYQADSMDVSSEEKVVVEGKDAVTSEKMGKTIHKKILNVYAREPLQVRLPMLGYTLRVDLIDFSLESDFKKNTTIGTYMGYYHFTPFTTMSRRDKRVFKNNRKKAYYNSRQHFCKSLIDGRLTENGYKISGYFPTKGGKLFLNKDINIDTCLHRTEHFTHITGLMEKEFSITYYQRWNSKPADLNKHYAERSYKSTIHFLSDTIMVFNSGNTPYQNLMFSGNISRKKAGAFLPENYSPEDDLSD